MTRIDQPTQRQNLGHERGQSFDDAPRQSRQKTPQQGAAGRDLSDGRGAHQDIALASQRFQGIIQAKQAESTPNMDEDRLGQSIVILPGDRLDPPQFKSLHQALGLTTQVEKVTAALETQIAQGQKAEVTRGAGGALTVDFPLPSTSLGLSAAKVVMRDGALELTLAATAAAMAGRDASLRELARTLALRHPDRLVRVSLVETDGDPNDPSQPDDLRKVAL